MNAPLAGVMLALAVVGYPLYELVNSGGLDATSALVRISLVAAGCTAGITVLVRLALGYEQQEKVARERRMNALFSSMEGAVAEGSLRPDGTAAGDGTAPAATSGAGSAATPGSRPAGSPTTASPAAASPSAGPTSTTP